MEKTIRPTRSLAKMLAPFVVLILSPISQTSAETLDNYGAWRQKPSIWKEGYVLGVYEQIFHEYVGFWNVALQPENRKMGKAMRKCIASVGLTNVMLLELVDKYYVDHVDQWGEPPRSIVETVFAQACEKFMHAEK